MANYKVVGVRSNIDFKTETGAQIQGTSLYCVVPAEQTEDFEGEEICKLFLSSFRFPTVDIHPGDLIKVFFSRKGKVDEYEVVGKF